MSADRGTQMAEASALKLALVFSWIGFAAPVPVVVTGFVFAVVGGLVGLAALPVAEREKDLRWEICKTVLTALFIGALFGVVQPKIGDFAGFLAPLGQPQFLPWAMGAGGLVSRWLARRVSKGDFSLPSFGRRGEGQ